MKHINANIHPTVIWEDEGIVALNKPAGLIVHPISARPEHEEPSVVSWLRHEYPAIGAVGDAPTIRPGIVHRLDRDTSGVLLVAKTQEAFSYLKQLFQTRAIVKTYVALLVGHLKDRHGTINKALGIKTGTTKRSVFSTRMAKEAVTSYRLKKFVGPCSLIEATPHTGRTHQLRVHFAFLGHPIVGDKLYGSKSPLYQVGRLMLHAAWLEFPRRPGTMVHIEAPAPDDFAAIVGTFEQMQPE